MAAAMSLDSAIVHCIREASEQRSLNATDIILNGHRVQWKSICGGPIGEMVFMVPLRRFEESIELGVSDVSTLISFASLTLQEENRGLAENIRNAVHCYGAPNYFQVIENMSRVAVSIGIPTEETYSSILVDYTINNETGEYTWEIPETEHVYASFQRSRPSSGGTEEPPSLTCGVSAYDAIGLHATQSAGLPVRGVSDSIRAHSDLPDTLVSLAELSDDSVHPTTPEPMCTEST